MSARRTPACGEEAASGMGERSRARIEGAASDLGHEHKDSPFEPRPFAPPSQRIEASPEAEGSHLYEVYLRQRRIAVLSGGLRSSAEPSTASEPVQPILGVEQHGADPAAPVQGVFTWKKVNEEDEAPSNLESVLAWMEHQGFPIDPLKQETLQDFLTHPETFEITLDSAGAERIAGWVTREFIGQAGYMTGDMYGLCAALLLDPGLYLRIFVDDGGYYRGQYESSARKYNQTLEEFYQSLHGRPYDAEELNGRLRGTAEGMVNFYKTSGVQESRIQVVSCADAQLEYAKLHKAPENRPQAMPRLERDAPKDPQLKEAHHGTETVAAHIKKDPERARAILASAWLDPVSEQDKLDINAYYERTFMGAGRVALLWGRISGRTPGGAHPELDSNFVVMAQLTGLLKRVFPGTTVALIGDEVMPPELVPLVGETHLVKFWNDLPNGRNRHNQLYFLDLLRQHNGAVALGMRSGAMEGPALLGMPTIYIDDEDCSFLPGGEREGAGRRMELFAGEGAPARTLAPQDTAEIEEARKGPLPEYKRLQTEQLLGQISQYVGEMDELLDDARAGAPGRWAQIRALIQNPQNLKKQKLDKTMAKLRLKHYRISVSQLAEHTELVQAARPRPPEEPPRARPKVYDRAAVELQPKLVENARYQWRDLADQAVTDRTTAHGYLQLMTQRLRDVGPPDGGDAQLVFDRFWPALDAIELGQGELEQVARLLVGFGLEHT